MAQSLTVPAPITAADLYLFRWADHVRISPDGTRVAYTLAWADAEARDNRSRVAVQGFDGASQPAELTPGPKRDHAPEWSPDGGSIAFLTRSGPKDQLAVIPAAGGAVRQLTNQPDGVVGLRWSPDGSRIAFLAMVVPEPDGVVDDPRKPESEDQARRAPIARVVRRLDYKHDGAGYSDGRYPHLFVVPAARGQPLQLTDGAWAVEGFDWAPSGDRLVIAGNAEPDSDLQRTKSLYIVDLAGSMTRVAGDLELSTPAWSPAGDLIAFLGKLETGSGLHDRVFVVSPAGGEPRCLTAGFDRSAGGSVINDMRGGHATRLVWKDGASIVFQASGPGVAGLWEVPVTGAGPVERVGGRRAVYDFDVRAGELAFLAGDVTRPGEVYGAGAAGERKLTDLNPWLAERELALPERMEFKAPDGWPIEGWLLKPAGFEAGAKHPLVMEIHGGPHGQYGWTFFHEFQVLASQGFLVFYVNPRGSDGYGEAFKKACVHDWGGLDYLDLMTSLDQLIERTDFVDEARMGVGGGSYGGYMTNWVVGHTDRFKAAVSMRSISNLVSEYAQHDIVLWSELEMGPQPWPDPDELWRRSPIRYVKQIQTPLLLLHSEMDLRCAISQAEELFGALRLLGKKVELIRFPGESHDLSRGGRPDRRIERLNRISGWFAGHLGAQTPEPVGGRTVTA